MFKKKIIKIFLAVVLSAALLIVGFGSGYWYGVKTAGQKPFPKPSSSSTALTPSLSPDTSDWKTYRNEEMGFEVKHPQGVVVFNEMPSQGQYDALIRFYIAARSPFHEIFEISMAKDRSFEQAFWDSGSRKTDFRKTSTFSISGLEGLREENFAHLSNGFLIPGETRYGVIYKNQLWQIRFSRNYPPELALTWTDTVVSTFQFID